jgi:hypothetical protein
MIGRWNTAIAACLAVLVTAPAEAREWPGEGAWTIDEDEGACSMGRTYGDDGDTLLVLRWDADNRSVLITMNENWSAKDGQSYDISFVADGKRHGATDAIGVEVRGKAGFMTHVDKSFLRDFISANRLSIFLGQTLVDELSLADTPGAIKILLDCVDSLPAARSSSRPSGGGRSATIPTDPFADRP